VTGSVVESRQLFLLEYLRQERDWVIMYEKRILTIGCSCSNRNDVKMFIAKKPEIRVFYVTNKVPRFQ
jgi:hypothetical protein